MVVERSRAAVICKGGLQFESRAQQSSSDYFDLRRTRKIVDNRTDNQDFEEQPGWG